MASFLSVHEPGFWLVIAVLAGVALLAGWSFTPRRWRSWLLPAYWIGIPYLALIAGAVSPRLMGLRFLDWPANLRLGGGLLLAVLGLVALGRIFLLFERENGKQSGDDTVSRPSPSRWLGVLLTVALCGAEEFYWCFLRGMFWELLQSLPWTVELPAYWSIWLAALLALPWALLPQPSAGARLAKVTILVVTSVVFLYTRNFWLCWFLHAAMWLMLKPQSLQDAKNHKGDAIRAIPL
jgi:hypothetical protein